MNLETRQAYSEVNKFLDLVGESLSSQIPINLKNFFKREMDKNYIPIINSNQPISEQNLKRKTITIISGLNLQYWCKNEEKKQKLRSVYHENGMKYQEEQNEKYNVDNLFKHKNTETIIKNGTEKSMIVYDEYPLHKRIFMKIKAFFSRR